MHTGELGEKWMDIHAEWIACKTTPTREYETHSIFQKYAYGLVVLCFIKAILPVLGGFIAPICLYICTSELFYWYQDNRKTVLVKWEENDHQEDG